MSFPALRPGKAPPIPSRIWPLFLIGLAFCVPAHGSQNSEPQDPESLIAQVDERFNRSAQERDRETFHDLLAPDAVFFAGEAQEGRLAVLGLWQHLFDGKFDFRYEAQTLETHAASSGEFGWSFGSVRTSFTRPGLNQPTVNQGHYLNLWRKKIAPEEDEESWELAYSGPLVVHPTLGEARSTRAALMLAWPELRDQIDAEITLDWTPQNSVRADSGDLAFVFGEYEAAFTQPASLSNGTEPKTETNLISGRGHYLTLWQKEASGRWHLAAESFTPPSIYRPLDTP